MKSNMKHLVKDWIEKWENGDYLNIPVSEDFKHTSPYGTIEGKRAYLDLTKANKEKFLGYKFEVYDELYGDDLACIRYTGTNRGSKLEVSEWYFASDNLLTEVVAYFNVGEIGKDGELTKPG